MKIQTSISGFSGKAVTILSLYDEDTGILSVAKAVEYREAKVSDDIALVSNIELPQRDAHFTDECLRDAIRNYFAMCAQDTLDLDDSLARFKPDNRIEQEKVDEGGRKYRVAPEIDNGQVAILAAAWYIDTYRNISSMLGAFDELSAFDDFGTI